LKVRVKGQKSYKLLTYKDMKKGRFTEMQNVSALKKQESGIGVKDIAWEMGLSEVTIYN